MNGIEDNEFSEHWVRLGKEIILPKAVLCISAHWFTKGTHITAMEKPPGRSTTLADFQNSFLMSGIPHQADPVLAKETASLIHKTSVGLDHEWGLDHGNMDGGKKNVPGSKGPCSPAEHRLYKRSAIPLRSCERTFIPS